MNDTANMIKFSDYMLHKDILNALDLLGLKSPTPVQREVIPHVLQKHDVIAQAQTGSGKTASYAIPLCELVDWEENKPQVMILTPTRELAIQVQQEITDIGKLKRIKAPALYGKQSFKGQEKDLKQKSHMVVGTPGRVLDHLERGTLFTGHIGYLVIDEADEMFHMGFIEQVEEIVKKYDVDAIHFDDYFYQKLTYDSLILQELDQSDYILYIQNLFLQVFHRRLKANRRKYRNRIHNLRRI